MAVVGSGLCQNELVFAAPVADKAFQFADGDGFALDAEDARSFALVLLRADTAADRGQQRVLGDGFGGSDDVAFGDVVDEVRYLDRYGAGFDAARFFAVEAARGFTGGFVQVVTVAHLFEIGGADFGILFPHGNSGYFVCHGCCFLSGGAGRHRVGGISGEGDALWLCFTADVPGTACPRV